MARAYIQPKITGLKSLRKKLKRISEPQPTIRAMHKRLVVVWRDAGHAFVREAIKNTLVDTGMTANSYWPLARAIRRKGTVPIVKAAVATKGPGKKGVPELPFGVRFSGQQGPRAGRIKGEKAFTFSVGTSKRPVFIFVFQTAVYQQAYWEPTWEAIAAGKKAFDLIVIDEFEATAAFTLKAWLQGKALVGKFPTKIPGKFKRGNLTVGELNG